MIRTHYRIEDHDAAKSCIHPETLARIVAEDRNTVHIIDGGTCTITGQEGTHNVTIMAIVTADDWIIEVPFLDDDFVNFFSEAIDTVVVNSQRGSLN